MPHNKPNPRVTKTRNFVEVSRVYTWTATVEALSLVFIFSKLPKSLLMASARAPEGSPEPPGHRF